MTYVIALVCSIFLGGDSLVRVGVANFPPMIEIDAKTGAISGSDYDMYEMLVHSQEFGWVHGVNYEYVPFESFDTLMSKIADGSVDQALNGITITYDRLKKMNFSLPYSTSGHRIMVPFKKEEDKGIIAYFEKFLRIEMLYPLCFFFLNCIVWGVIIFLVEKFFRKDVEPNIKTVEHGALAAFDAGTTIGFGRYFPVTRIGQVVAMGAFFCGAICVADVISTLTTNKIVQRFDGGIQLPRDLKGKTVAIVSGTTSEDIVKQYDPASIISCSDFYKAVVELRLGNVDAVVADDPVVRNYVKNNPTHASLAGPKFHDEDYGIAFKNESDPELIKKFSTGIIKLRESGRLATIENQWFGE